jgi:hypothetical protein
MTSQLSEAGVWSLRTDRPAHRVQAGWSSTLGFRLRLPFVDQLSQQSPIYYSILSERGQHFHLK